MGNLSVSTGAGGAGEAYKAAKEARASQDQCSPENAKAVVEAAKAAAQQDGEITTGEKDFIGLLEKDTGILEIAEEKGEHVRFTSPHQEGNKVDLGEIRIGTAEKNVSFVDDKPRVNVQPKYTADLKNVAREISADSSLREKITGSAENRFRAEGFLHAMDKVNKGKALTSDDVEDIQIFLKLDGKMIDTLQYKGCEDGVDGIYGARTNEAVKTYLESVK